MVFLITIIHIIAYTLFFLGSLANYVVCRAIPYAFLLIICAVQIIVDIVILASPATTTTLIVASNVTILWSALGISTLIAQLFNMWIRSMESSIPRRRIAIMKWSTRTIHLMHGIVGAIGGVGLILLGFQSTFVVGLQIWTITLYFFVIITLYLLLLELVLGINAIHRVPAQVKGTARKIRQLFRLVIVTALLGVYFTAIAIGMYSYSPVPYVLGYSLYLVIIIVLFPRALYAYDAGPGQREVIIDPDGNISIHITPNTTATLRHASDVSAVPETSVALLPEITEISEE